MASKIRRATELKAPFLQCDKYFHTISLHELHGKSHLQCVPLRYALTLIIQVEAIFSSSCVHTAEILSLCGRPSSIRYLRFLRNCYICCPSVIRPLLLSFRNHCMDRDQSLWEATYPPYLQTFFCFKFHFNTGPYGAGNAIPKCYIY